MNVAKLNRNARIIVKSIGRARVPVIPIKSGRLATKPIKHVRLEEILKNRDSQNSFHHTLHIKICFLENSICRMYKDIDYVEY